MQKRILVWIIAPLLFICSIISAHAAPTRDDYEKIRLIYVLDVLLNTLTDASQDATRDAITYAYQHSGEIKHTDPTRQALHLARYSRYFNTNLVETILNASCYLAHPRSQISSFHRIVTSLGIHEVEELRNIKSKFRETVAKEMKIPLRQIGMTVIRDDKNLNRGEVHLIARQIGEASEKMAFAIATAQIDLIIAEISLIELNYSEGLRWDALKKDFFYAYSDFQGSEQIKALIEQMIHFAWESPIHRESAADSIFDDIVRQLIVLPCPEESSCLIS